MCRQSATVCLTKSPALGSVTGLPLVERLRVLPDPRRRRGVRHPFVAVLLVAASAALAGARSYAAIGQWSGNAPQHALARLGARVVGALGVRVAPSAATIRRVVGLVCPGGLADLTGADPAGSDSVDSTARPPEAPGTASCPLCPPAGRDDRRRPHRHPTAGSRQDQVRVLLLVVVGQVAYLGPCPLQEVMMIKRVAP
ncbi:transposase family protein [Streptomyces sp. CA-135486]|uniref:transposase family protein n=1 Tax=Streptomyces sp. CA-135486 TaxID=3240049 RepID=UPI003D92A4B8